MGLKYVFGQPQLGRIFLPEVTISYPKGGMVRTKHQGVVCATTMRPRWSSLGLLKLPEIAHPIDPAKECEALVAPYRSELATALFERECVWASVTHNERVASGSKIQHNRVTGITGANILTANGVINVVAVGGVGAAPTLSTTLTKTATDLSMGSGSANVTTNEQTTVGLSRAVGTAQNATAASGSLDGTQSSDVVKLFTASGNSTSAGAALFDSTTVAGSFLYCEDNFTSNAVLVNLDQLTVTWTITF